MPLRVSNHVESNVIAVPQPPIVVKAATSTRVLPSLVGDKVEYAGRYIQNVGANPCYYSIGGTCSPQQFSGILSGASAVDAGGFGSGQQLDVSNTGDSVNIYSAIGTTIAITLLRRNDMNQGAGGILNPGSLTQ